MIMQRLIGRVVIAWSILEASLNDLIWVISGLGMEDGRTLRERQDITDLVSTLRMLGEGHLTDQLLKPRLGSLLDAVDNLKGDRNTIIHGSWGEIDGVPVVASFRKEASGRTEVFCEEYSHERMRKIALDVSQCTKIVMMTIKLVKSSREKQNSQSVAAAR
jgi:hypothetical protein